MIKLQIERKQKLNIVNNFKVGDKFTYVPFLPSPVLNPTIYTIISVDNKNYYFDAQILDKGRQQQMIENIKKWNDVVSRNIYKQV